LAGDLEKQLAHYIALIHNDSDISCAVSFPDVPGVVAAAYTIDEAIDELLAARELQKQSEKLAKNLPRYLARRSVLTAHAIRREVDYAAFRLGLIALSLSPI
jgi:predicted RNase H-like HicB family nuclease